MGDFNCCESWGRGWGWVPKKKKHNKAKYIAEGEIFEREMEERGTIRKREHTSRVGEGDVGSLRWQPAGSKEKYGFKKR